MVQQNDVFSKYVLSFSTCDHVGACSLNSSKSYVVLIFKRYELKLRGDPLFAFAGCKLVNKDVVPLAASKPLFSSGTSLVAERIFWENVFLSQPFVLSCGSFSSSWWFPLRMQPKDIYEYGCIKIIWLRILSFNAPRIPWD